MYRLKQNFMKQIVVGLVVIASLFAIMSFNHKQDQQDMPEYVLLYFGNVQGKIQIFYGADKKEKFESKSGNRFSQVVEALNYMYGKGYEVATSTTEKGEFYYTLRKKK
jgi:hypothetical protein